MKLDKPPNHEALLLGDTSRIILNKLSLKLSPLTDARYYCHLLIICECKQMSPWPNSQVSSKSKRRTLDAVYLITTLHIDIVYLAGCGGGLSCITIQHISISTEELSPFVIFCADGHDLADNTHPILDLKITLPIHFRLPVAHCHSDLTSDLTLPWMLSPYSPQRMHVHEISNALGQWPYMLLVRLQHNLSTLLCVIFFSFSWDEAFSHRLHFLPFSPL